MNLTWELQKAHLHTMSWEVKRDHSSSLGKCGHKNGLITKNFFQFFYFNIMEKNVSNLLLLNSLLLIHLFYIDSLQFLFVLFYLISFSYEKKAQNFFSLFTIIKIIDHNFFFQLRMIHWFQHSSTKNYFLFANNCHLFHKLLRLLNFFVAIVFTMIF